MLAAIAACGKGLESKVSVNDSTDRSLAPKARKLEEISRAGIRVPDFVAFNCHVTERHFNTSELEVVHQDILSRLGMVDSIIMRPCLYQEDSNEMSYAGVMSSKLVDVKALSLSNLFHMINTCIEEVIANETIKCYVERHGQTLRKPSEVTFIFQRFICGSSSGVMFTQNPVTRADEYVIESNFGLNCLLTDGRISPDRFIVHKSDMSIQSAVLGSKKRQASVIDGEIHVSEQTKREEWSLSNDQVLALCGCGSALQDLFGSPQDVEWTYDQDALFILQSRAITSL